MPHFCAKSATAAFKRHPTASMKFRSSSRISPTRLTPTCRCRFPTDGSMPTCSSIEDAAGDLPKRAAARIVVYLPIGKIAPGLESRLNAYLGLFRRLRIDKVKRLERRALNDVLKALLWGVVFMLCCQIVRYFADFPSLPTVTSTISEGMLVLGWVALWNPYDRLLFAWRPEVRRRRLLERIASFPLVLRPLTGTAASRLAVRTPESGR